MMPLLLLIVTFLSVACVVFAIWFLAGGGAKQDVVAQRLDAVRMAERRGNDSQDLKIVRDEMLSALPMLNRIFLQWSWVGDLKKFSYQAGLTARPDKIFLLSGITGLVTSIVVGYVYGEPILSVVAGIMVAAMPLGVIALMRGRRLRRFETQFPDALDLLGRAVRAGHAFTTGLELIASECDEPISAEFRTTYEEQSLGLPLRDSLLNLTERVPLIDVRLFVIALLVQRDVGGNLAEILDELARVVRERFRIYGDVKTKSAQGKLTAAILVALPFAMAAVIGYVNPGYVRMLFDDPILRIVLMVALCLQGIGSMILWKIVHIEV